MDYDIDKAAELALALMYLTLHDKSDFDGSCRAWKGIDFEVMNHLHEKGLILDPANKNKSVVVTPEGVKKAEDLFKTMLKNS
ncbi:MULTISPECIES: DUF6429 family protein [Photobacterium]|uniref:DUF6429 family protein n=1 Tax=Photobacterium TaxID=657 RepID=UPI0021C2D583|nr:DUF6429 family protein [Photobacterium sanguinicancri]